ncbi:DUF805 domain-containing protein [Histidinibacterium lentulum]|uniref:DUF805 domain-containing protein n=1 Tax=Histidinibacterium lentulum TaxID=2480588 RepID=A0A3N2R110_9RHOB|nr:DUF805 domain-containing protein [Histidinibacterium lentulum]ROU01161.1 DUF805 domain-containing protein [Histidinibacterium lentulum]
MTFTESVKTVATQKYFDFSGRASRSEFWWWMLAYVLGAIVVSFVPLLPIVYALALFLPTLGVGWRRMQDIGKPGWYFLIPSIYNVFARLVTPSVSMEMDPSTGMPTEMPGMGAMAWSSLVGIIGFVIAIVFLIFLVRKSDPGPNAYGPPPTS